MWPKRKSLRRWTGIASKANSGTVGQVARYVDGGLQCRNESTTSSEDSLSKADGVMVFP